MLEFDACLIQTLLIVYGKLNGNGIFLQQETPGPGTYGKGGVPHAAVEEKGRKSASTVGMLDAGASGERSLPIVVCPDALTDL